MFRFLSAWLWIGLFFWVSGGLNASTWYWMVLVPAVAYFIWGVLRAGWWLLNPPQSPR